MGKLHHLLIEILTQTIRYIPVEETDVSTATLDSLLLTVSDGKLMEELEIVCDRNRRRLTISQFNR